jgi:AcrR family transcriptional regulator
LAKQGWGALNTKAIAEVAGMLVRSVCGYFPNKEAIVDRILEQHLDGGRKLIECGSQYVTEATDTGQVARLLVAGFVGLHQDDPELHRVLLSEVPMSPKQKQKIEVLKDDMARLTPGALRGKVAAPELKAAPVVDATNALTHRWIVGEAGAPVDQTALAQELEKMLSSYLNA